MEMELVGLGRYTSHNMSRSILAALAGSAIHAVADNAQR